MQIQTLIATMKRRSVSELNVHAMKVPGNAVVVNQFPGLGRTVQTEVSDGAVMFTVDQKGLSRSRNAAIRLATADICAIADDDITYLRDAERAITDAFRRHPEADVICFMAVDNTGKPLRRYETRPRYLRTYNAGFVASITIVFRLGSILRAGIRFDEDFGLGSLYPTGEEYIFLADAIRTGRRVLFLPTPIVMHGQESSGVDYRNPHLLTAKGAVIARVFGVVGVFVLPAFFAKTVALRTNPSSWFWTLGYMIRGWLQQICRNRRSMMFRSRGQ